MLVSVANLHLFLYTSTIILQWNLHGKSFEDLGKLADFDP